ncbi:MAG: hydrogenase 3 maturation endopeptidase HyCI [Candidatus Omnitrophica bacterium]|nr:hydrogenase 3 maturation endopeptidase HyCI [Candidatus Omnitrophota bacterium]MDD5352496.1 hydrogenase 3 maturation endopeptidase HyCI [Candidatus Omnitrophota bacterium]MDD5550094.1 hydrogenase 3 maturation endopeptidase HyCI [Candidatus Omnitrophota bacterium]
MPLNPEDLRKELPRLFQGKVLIVGIGNQLRADDGFGPALINKIKGKIKAECLDAGLSPENYMGSIVRFKPDVILLVDAVSMNEPVAAIRLIGEEQIPEYGFSTHNMSPKLMIENIKSQIKTKIFLLGIQPQSLEFGKDISAPLRKQLNLLGNIFMEILGNNEAGK